MLFLFDENFPPKFVEGFSILVAGDRKQKITSIIQTSSEFMNRLGASDEEIIRAATQRNAIIVTHDGDFKRIKHYKPLLVQHRVGFICFRVPKGTYRYWDIVKAFVNKWEEIVSLCSDSSHPFALEVTKQGQINKLGF